MIAAGALGVATAEAPTGTSSRTVSVQGVAIEAIDQSASASVATAVYRQGMGDAIADGLSKAQFLASRAGVGLGPVQSVTEDGGFIECPGETEYAGAQPDFGSGRTAIVAPALEAQSSAGSPAVKARPAHPPARHRRRHARRPAAKKANVTGCTLTANVSLVYALS
jgi:hypothetical protein